MGLSNITVLRKREIVKAFYQTAVKEGLEGTSIAKIAKTLEIQPSLIVHYYKSKDELITALIDHCLELYLKIFEESYSSKNDPRAMLVALINRMFSKDWNDLFDDGVYYSAYAMVFREPAFREKFSKIHRTLREQLSDLLEKCDQSGEINCENPSLTANRIFFLLDGTYFFINMLSTQKEQNEHLKQSKLLAFEMLGLK